MVLICKGQRNGQTSNRLHGSLHKQNYVKRSRSKWEYHVCHMQKTLLFELGQMTCKNHFRVVRVSSWSVFSPRAPCLDYLMCFLLCYDLWQNFLSNYNVSILVYIYYFCIWLGPWGLYMEEKSLLFVSMSHLLKSMHLCILKKVRLSWPCLVSSNELNILKIICITVAFEYSTWPFSI
jgi:hypothetical protein